jgi:transposase
VNATLPDPSVVIGGASNPAPNPNRYYSIWTALFPFLEQGNIYNVMSSLTNTTVVNTDTMYALLRLVAARGLCGPITLVLDNARYQRNAIVMGLAQELGIELLFLPSYAPNLNLIERLWRFVKRKAVYGRYHPTFAEFRAAVQDVLDRVPTTHAEKLASLMTLNFQEFDNVSLLAA